MLATGVYLASDTLYTGAPFARTDGLGLQINRPFDHPRFPVVAGSGGAMAG